MDPYADACRHFADKGCRRPKDFLELHKEMIERLLREGIDAAAREASKCTSISVR
jgi:hypothetical protein